MSYAPNEISAAEAGRRIARGRLTSEALVAACLERIAARERDVRAWAHWAEQIIEYCAIE